MTQYRIHLRTMLAALAAGLLLTSALTAPAHAGISQQVPVGPRAIAMGGAYSSIADDATALYWNPAGLPWIQHQEITAAHADLYNTGIKDNYAAFALPLSPTRAAAIDFYHSGYDDEELGFGETRIDLAYGQKIGSKFSLGATIGYLTRKTDLDGVEVRRGNGVGFSAGLLSEPIDRLRVAFVGQDIFDTDLNYSGAAGTATAYTHTWRGAVSYTPFRWGTVALDIDDRYHLGAEYRPIQYVALRAGIQDDLKGDDSNTLSFGAGVNYGIFRFDYALVEHSTLGSTNNFGISLDFNFNPSQVRIEKVEAHDLYASFYKTYAKTPFGKLQIRNLDDKPLTTKLSVYVPSLMEQPSEQEVVLRPRATQDVPLTAVFSNRMLEQQGDRPVQVEIEATYQSLHLARSDRGAGRCVVYGPGAIDWSAGVAQAAAFVTSRDPSVDQLAREATHSIALAGPGGFGNRNVAFAAALFDALAVLGMAYVPDPNNPYATISGTPRAVDTISYPRETLARRTGDCDDSSVLLAALLGNVGIRTEFVDVPGHLFLLVDTGVHERNRIGLALDESQYVLADESVWIPLETTALGKGFAEAWQTGADSYRSWASRGRATLVDVDSALTLYEPVEPPGQPPPLPALDMAALNVRLANDSETVEGWRAAYLATMFQGAQEKIEASPSALNEIAHVYFLSGKLAEAQQTLEIAMAKDRGYVPTLNNLGNVYAAMGDLGKAAEYYESALRLDEADAGMWLNLGLVRYAAGDTAGADAPLAQGVTRSGGYVESCRLLGLAPDEGIAREGTDKLTAEEARQLLKAALAKVPKSGAAATATVPSGSTVTPSRAWTSRVAAGRSAEEAAIDQLLYWKLP